MNNKTGVLRQMSKAQESNPDKESVIETIEVKDLAEAQIEHIGQATTADVSDDLEPEVPKKRRLSSVLGDNFGLSEFILAPGTFITRKPSGPLKKMFDDKTK